MNPIIVIFGANGFLGRYLCRHFAQNGKEVVAIARSREGWSGDGMFLEWDGKTLGPWALALEGAEAVINLAGRSVNCRYTEKNRQEILESRVDATRVIGQAISARRPRCLATRRGTPGPDADRGFTWRARGGRTHPGLPAGGGVRRLKRDGPGAVHDGGQ